MIDATALILAGGLSRRMGHDKATLVFRNKPLLEEAIALAQSVFAEVILSVREPRVDFKVTQVVDSVADGGPLYGLLEGLKVSTKPWVFAVAVDMPFMDPAVIRYLFAHRTGVEAVVPLVGEHVQPLGAFYSASLVTKIRELLDSNSPRHSLMALIERAQVRFVPETDLRSVDAQLRSYIDLDTPEDFRYAQNLVGRGEKL